MTRDFDLRRSSAILAKVDLAGCQAIYLSKRVMHQMDRDRAFAHGHEATRFTFPERMSPTANTAGRPSQASAAVDSVATFEASARTGSKSRPVRTNPCLSRATQPRNHSRGDAPAITKRITRHCLPRRSVKPQVTHSRCVNRPPSMIAEVQFPNAVQSSMFQILLRQIARHCPERVFPRTSM